MARVNHQDNHRLRQGAFCHARPHGRFSASRRWGGIVALCIVVASCIRSGSFRDLPFLSRAGRSTAQLRLVRPLTPHENLDVGVLPRGAGGATTLKATLDAELSGLSTEVVAQPVEAEVVSATGSRPAQLFFSSKVQEFVRLCTKLKEIPVQDDDPVTVLEQLVLELKGAIEDIRDEAVTIPDDFKADIAELKAKIDVDAIVADATAIPRVITDVQSSRFSRRVPEAIERLLPWDSLYPPALAARTGVDQSQVKGALKALASVDFSDMSTWSEHELSEAADLVDRNEALRDIRQACILAVQADLLGSVLAVVLVGVVPLILLVALVASCAGALGNSVLSAIAGGT